MGTPYLKCKQARRDNIYMTMNCDRYYMAPTWSVYLIGSDTYGWKSGWGLWRDRRAGTTYLKC